MEFRILGPLEAEEGAPVALPRGRPQALLALLLLHANETLALERLVEELWERAPDSAAKMVQIAVSQLRKALPGLALRTRAPGYTLELDGHALDLERFERLAAEGREQLAAGDAGRAAATLAEALELWRGPALGEFDEPFARREAARLEELRLAALEDRIDADLAVGRHFAVTGELESLVERHPLRERLRAAQMLALFRSGRQAEALAAYQEYRKRLADELGLQPSSDLRELESRILKHDAELALPRRGTTPTAAAAPGKILYAQSGDVSIAYQVVGAGPLDLVLVHGWVCTFQPAWENPRMAAFYRRLASFGRLILFDKRGTGLSDRVSIDRLPDLETRMDDVRAVMDAAGSERAVVIGISEGGPLSTLFAATYPERTVALVLLGTFARTMWAPDYEIGFSGAPDERRPARHTSAADADWGARTTREWLEATSPGVLRDEEAFRWYVSYVARGASPGAILALEKMNAQIDVRDVLDAVRVPTLVLYRAGEAYREATRYMGERIAGAQIVELDGSDHLPWEGDTEQLVDAIERFVAASPATAETDRVLATVLFTDIVGSTAKAAELGDRAWRELLERHRAVVRGHLDRFRGRVIDTAGDGFLATFDGPARAVRCAAEIVRDVRRLGLEVRSGVHTGEIELTDGAIGGIAVHIGARVAAAAAAGEVLVSGTVKDIVAGSGLEFEDRGERELKGVPGAWRLFAYAG